MIQRLKHLSIQICISSFLLLCSCGAKSPCEEVLNSNLLQHIDRILTQYKDYNPPILKVLFLETYDNNEKYIIMMDDIRYSERVNHFQYNGYLIRDNTMVAFYKMDDWEEHPMTQMLRPCILTNTPPERYPYETEPEDAQGNSWEFGITDKGTLKLTRTGLNHNIKINFDDLENDD